MEATLPQLLPLKNVVGEEWFAKVGGHLLEIFRVVGALLDRKSVV